jgi:hypothetical protein
LSPLAARAKATQDRLGEASGSDAENDLREADRVRPTAGQTSLAGNSGV